jgi:hypothetical protein
LTSDVPNALESSKKSLALFAHEKNEKITSRKSLEEPLPTEPLVLSQGNGKSTKPKKRGGRESVGGGKEGNEGDVEGEGSTAGEEEEEEEEGKGEGEYICCDGPYTLGV